MEYVKKYGIPAAVTLAVLYAISNYSAAGSKALGVTYQGKP